MFLLAGSVWHSLGRNWALSGAEEVAQTYRPAWPWVQPQPELHLGSKYSPGFCPFSPSSVGEVQTSRFTSPYKTSSDMARDPDCISPGAWCKVGSLSI